MRKKPKQKRRGRPVLTVRMDPYFRNALQEAADSLGVTLSVYVRSLLVLSVPMVPVSAVAEELGVGAPQMRLPLVGATEERGHHARAS